MSFNNDKLVRSKDIFFLISEQSSVLLKSQFYVTLEYFEFFRIDARFLELRHGELRDRQGLEICDKKCYVHVTSLLDSSCIRPTFFSF